MCQRHCQEGLHIMHTKSRPGPYLGIFRVVFSFLPRLGIRTMEETALRAFYVTVSAIKTVFLAR
jgi:hypothetical protein